ncbi:hypothetical protein LC040_01165 [Bacillus tianshenii]|nr:hypothetical protein LC040_01165 [Bacillus tianshenii]
MSKRNKSKRFAQQSADAVKKHDERIPYYSTMEEAQQRKEKLIDETSLGSL